MLLHNKKFTTFLAVLLSIAWLFFTLLFFACLHESALLRDEIDMLQFLSALAATEFMLLLHLY